MILLKEENLILWDILQIIFFIKMKKNTEFIIEIKCAGIRDNNIQIKGKAFSLIEGRKIFPE